MHFAGQAHLGHMQQLYGTLPKPGVYAALLLLMAYAKVGDVAAAHRTFDAAVRPALPQLTRYGGPGPQRFLLCTRT